MSARRSNSYGMGFDASRGFTLMSAIIWALIGVRRYGMGRKPLKTLDKSKSQNTRSGKYPPPPPPPLL